MCVSFIESPADYDAIEGTLIFGTPNKTGFMRCELIGINDDGIEESSEMFTVNLVDPSGLDDIIILGPQTVNVTIEDCKFDFHQRLTDFQIQKHKLFSEQREMQQLELCQNILSSIP